MRILGLAGVFAGLAALGVTSSAQAALFTYILPDIGSFPGYTDSNVAQTFGGDGFAGMYSTRGNGVPAFVHILGVEATDHSRTNVQVNLGGLAGHAITAATLSFILSVGDPGPQTIGIVGYAGTGALGYVWDAPPVNYGLVQGDVSKGVNALNVLDLVAASVAAGDAYLNLHIQGLTDEQFLWTNTFIGFGSAPDSAELRLTIDATLEDAAAIPEPSTLLLLGAGLAGFGAFRLRRFRKAPALS